MKQVKEYLGELIKSFFFSLKILIRLPEISVSMNDISVSVHKLKVRRVSDIPCPHFPFIGFAS